MFKLLSLSFFLILLFIFTSSPTSAQVVINEFVANSDPEWVEFYNSSGSADYLKSYWLDDDTNFEIDSNNSKKKPLANLNTENSSYPYFELSNFLNNKGDDVVLFDQYGKRVDYHHYDNDPGKDVAIGRSPDNTGSFAVLESGTKGSGNSGPKPDPTSTPGPTDTPTKTPTSVPTSKPTPQKTSSLTPRVMPQQDANDSNNRIDLGGRTENTDILGLRNKMNSTDNDVKLGDGGISDGGKFPWESVLFILSGGGFIGSGVYLYKKYQKENSSEKKTESAEKGFKLD